MDKKISKIKNNVQDRSSEAWIKLCEYVEYTAKKGKKEFNPRKYLGDELFAQIYTLPESIGKLKKVKKVSLYGSNLERIPPEIGEMESLEYFDPYTSYNLKWFPYELTKCKNLRDSRVSTRAVYGNFKNRKRFPKLDHNPIRYLGENVKCSVCEKQMSYNEINQLWTTQRVGTDTLPFLANLCSKECEEKIPHSPKGYVQFPHKGGADLKQPTYEEWENSNVKIIPKELIENKKSKKPKLLKLIKKIWKK